MTVVVKYSELSKWTSNTRISIIGMTVLSAISSYELEYYETSPDLILETPEPQRATLLPPINKSSSETKLIVKDESLETCPTCGVGHTQGKECFICAPMARAAVNAKRIRREYAIRKQASRDEDGARLPYKE